LSTASNWIGVQTGVHSLDSTQTCGFKNIWSRGLVKQLWPPDECIGGQGGDKSTTFTAKGCVLSTQQEKSFKWTDPSEWWWKEERLTSRKRLWLPAIGTWGYPIRAYKWLGAMSVMFPVCMTPGPHSSISEEFLHSIILRPKKQLETSQYELIPNFRNRKIPRFLFYKI